MMSLCVTSFANDLAEDEEIRGDFIYEKGTNNILAYVGTSDICEIPENSNLLGLNHIKQTHTAIKKLIINKNVTFRFLIHQAVWKKLILKMESQKYLTV